MHPWSDYEDEVQVDVRSLLKRRRVHRRFVRRSETTPQPPPVPSKPETPVEGEEPVEEEEEEEESEEELGGEGSGSESEGESSADSECDSECSDSSLDSSDSEDEEDEEDGEEEDEEDEEEEGEEGEEKETPSSPNATASKTAASSIGGSAEETAKVTSDAEVSGPTDSAGQVLGPVVSFTSVTRSSVLPAQTSLSQEQLSRVAAESVTSLNTVSETQESEGLPTPAPTLSRGAAAGIAVGSLGLLALIIAGVILVYKRRKRAVQDNSDAYPPEKGYYWSPESRDNHSPRSQSEIMDQAMAAAYAAETGHGTGNGLSDGFDASEDERAYSLEPSAPVPAHLPTDTDAAGALAAGTRPQRGRSGGSWPEAGQYDAPATGNDLDIYPPGQVPIDKYRVPSMAQTEVTATTESTWRTWNVNQGPQKPKGWREKYLR